MAGQLESVRRYIECSYLINKLRNDEHLIRQLINLWQLFSNNTTCNYNTNDTCDCNISVLYNSIVQYRGINDELFKEKGDKFLNELMRSLGHPAYCS